MPKSNHSACNLFNVAADCFTRGQLKDSCLLNGSREILGVANYWAMLDKKDKPALVSSKVCLELDLICLGYPDQLAHQFGFRSHKLRDLIGSSRAHRFEIS